MKWINENVMIEKEDCDTRPAQQFCVYFNEEDVLITRISSTFHLAAVSSSWAGPGSGAVVTTEGRMDSAAGEVDRVRRQLDKQDFSCLSPDTSN